MTPPPLIAVHGGRRSRRESRALLEGFLGDLSEKSKRILTKEKIADDFE